MKKIIITFIVTLNLNLFINTSYSQTGYNAVIEYSAATWTQWSPCGDEIIEQILQNYPNTVTLAYHGAGSDPWKSYSSGMINLFGINAYPTGIIGRRTGIIGRTSWNDEITLQTLLTQPGVSIIVSNKYYDSTSRTLSASINYTSKTDLTGNFYVNYILTENNLIYNQTGNGSCIGGVNYIHNHVVKSMLNGDLGELIHSGNWNNGENVLQNINFVLPNSPQILNVSNCELNVLVYKQGTNISTNYNIQQSLKTPVISTISFPNIRLNLKLLSEGLYSQIFNQLTRSDSVKAYLCNSVSPYNKIDSSQVVIDSLTHTGEFIFENAPTGNYYIVVKHFNSLETWSKFGGEYLINNGLVTEYDFTTSISQAFGNNLKLKGSWYCLFSGDVTQDGYINLSDVILINNDASNFTNGSYLLSDLTGDNIVDLTDVTLCSNNAVNFVSVIRP